ncbi:MAG: CHAT domain-containing protein [Planctomycetota bacterium]
MNTIEIASLKISAQIVFLSACDTAKGRLSKAYGVRNAARSFMLAGAESVIATQWSVRDDAAPVLAQVFYDELFRGATPARALRDAKLS